MKNTVTINIIPAAPDLVWSLLHDISCAYNTDYKNWCKSLRLKQNASENETYYKSLTDALPLFMQVTGVTEEDLQKLNELRTTTIKDFSDMTEDNCDLFYDQLIKEKLQKCKITHVKKDSTYEITLSKKKAAMHSYAISHTDKKGNYIAADIKAKNAIEAAEKYAKRKIFGKNIFKYVNALPLFMQVTGVTEEDLQKLKVKTFDAETKGGTWTLASAPETDSSGEFINISVEFYK